MLPNKALDDGSTVSGLVGAPIASAEFKSLILLKSGLDWPPLFFAPGLSCDVKDLQRLATLISCHHPIYGLQPTGLDGLTKPAERIEEMGQHYLAEIHAIQPSGPYALAGHSIGGLIALEIAQRLSGSGQEIAFLGFLDTYPLPKYWPFKCWMSVFLQRAKHHVRVLRALPRGEMILHAVRLGESFFDHLRNRHGHIVRRKWSAIEENAPPALDHVRRCTLAAWGAYRPKYYSGTITFLKAAVDTVWPSDPAVIWGSLARTLEIHNVTGDHSSMCTTHAEDVAARLSCCLEDSLEFNEALPYTTSPG